MKDKSENIPQSIDEWNGSYVKRIFPYIGISIVAHLLLIAILFGLSLMHLGGQGLTVTLFNPGQPGAGLQNPPLVAGFDAPERMKIFRIDFFRQIIPWSPPPPEPSEAEVPEPIEVEAPKIDEEEPVEEEVPEETVEEPVEEPTEEVPESTVNEERVLIGEVNDLLVGEEIPVMENPATVPGPTIPRYPINPDEDEILPDSLVLYGSEYDVSDSENVLLLPEWTLPGPDNLAWTNDFFLGNYTIYIVADISRRHGMDELLAWNYVLKMLITNPQAAFPPNMVNVGTALENPYAFNNTLVQNLLQEASEVEHTFGVMIADPGGLIAKSVGYRELIQPFVMFVDDNGFVRLIMQGRIRDISNANINSAMGVIAEMWQWDPSEMDVMPTAVTLLINILRDQAYDVDERKIEPTESALTVAPTWGYPPTLPEDAYVRPEDENYVSF